MQKKRLSIALFLGILIDEVSNRTGIKCVDEPDNEQSPLYGIEFVSSKPSDTKTMYVDAYEVWFHCISKPTEPYSNAPVLELVQKLEEALSYEIPVPEPFVLCGQDYQGLQTLKRDPSDEGHAVLSYTFRITYGFKCK